VSEPRSVLEGLFRSTGFVVTAELETTDSADPASVADAVAPLRGKVDAVNCTDNSAAHPHVSQVAAARLLIDQGVEPIVQFAQRDRNRIALQADILGASALGVRNFVMMTGDDVSAGDHGDAKPIYDLDSLHALRIARIMRDEGTYLSGRALTGAPEFFLGAVENPFAPPFDYRPARLAKKVEAGAEFVQLQCVFDVGRLRAFMEEVGKMGLLDRAFVAASVCILRSARGAHYMAEQVPGVDVPAPVLERIDGAAPQDQASVGREIALETVAAVREIPGIAGVHLMCIRSPETIAEVIEDSGLLPRPGRA
jgi:methylenetetrahydrofolate reductase (NADPH)